MPQQLAKFFLSQSEFAVPENEVLDDEPVGEDAGFYQKIGDGYVRIGRLFQPAYFERFQDMARELATNRAEPNKAAKDLKHLKEKYKNDFDTYEKSLKAANAEKKAALEALTEKNKELQRWQKTHSQLVHLHARTELEADFEHNLRLVENEKAKHEYESLAKKVNKLRSEAETFNITETEVKDKFNQLCAKTLIGCLGHFIRYVHRDRQLEMQDLASELGFQKAIKWQATLLGSGFGKVLLQLIIEIARDEYLLSLGQWWSKEPQNIDLEGMKKIDADMAEKVIGLQNPPPSSPTRKKNRREQRFDEEAQRKTLETMEMYIRWRADTTRLQLRLDEQKPRNEPDGEDVATSTAQAVVKRITGEIAQNFFATLLRATSSEVTLPIQLFETEGEDAAKQLRRFEQKLQDCVEAAMDLYRYMRRSKAHWSFDWVESNTLDEETMDFCEEQKTAYTEEVMRARAKKGQLEVLYCITPVLAKYGDDDGQDFRRRKVLQTAKVVVARIPEESRTLGSVWKQTKDQVATNNSVKGSAESERDGASTDRGRDTHQTDEPQPSRWATPRIFSGIY